MIAICPRCKNHEWDKTVEDNQILCPKCGMRWNFTKKPFYIITGCSGVGKTSTGIALQKITQDYVVLDADMFHNIMPHETEEDSIDIIEQMQSLSKNISQCGKPVVWTKAGDIDKLLKTYSVRFFSRVKVLALTCTENELRRRMTEGRGITDADWLTGSVNYNHYFRTHTELGDVAFDTLDISDMTPEDAAVKVLDWLQKDTNNTSRKIQPLFT